MPDTSRDAVDVFISYAREDRQCAERLAAAFSACEWRVWWDREIEVGADFGARIESNLLSARAVIVLWSEQSIHSGFVKDEAARARDASKLHPVRIADVSLPIGFGQLQTFDLLECGTADADVAPLIQQLGRALSKPRAANASVRSGPGLWRLFNRTSTRAIAAAVVAAVVVAVIGRGWWREKQCNQAFVRTDAGVEKLQDGNTEQAVDFFTEAIRMCGGQALPYRYRGEAYARLNDYPPAIADLNVALSLGLEDHARKRAAALLDTISKAQENGAIPVSTEHASTTGQAVPTSLPGVPFKKITGRGGSPAPPSPVPPPSAPAPKPSEVSTAATPPSGNSPAADAETQLAVKNMFAPDKETRIAATTSLVLDAQRAATAVPAALRTAGDQITNTSGIVNTLVLLQSAGPKVLHQHRDEIDRLLTRAERNGSQTAELATKVRAAFSPLVHLQIASEAQQPLARRLRSALQADGFEVPAVENASAKAAIPAAAPEVRAQGASGRGVAQMIGAIVQDVTATKPRILSIANARPARDTYEVWLDQRTCVDPQHRPAACLE